jgi:O-antigen ligase
MLALGGLVLSGSLSAAGGLVVGIAVAAVLGGPRLRRRATQPQVLAGAAVAVVVFVAAVSVAVASGRMASPWERLTQTTKVTTSGELEQEQATLWRRLDTLGAGWERIREHPFTGAGVNPDNLGLAGDTFVHNTFLGTWASLGLLAAIGLIICMAVPFVAGYRLLGSGRAPRALVAGLVGSAASFTVYALANPALYRRYCWLPALLLVALSAPEQKWSLLARRGRRESSMDA